MDRLLNLFRRGFTGMAVEWTTSLGKIDRVLSVTTNLQKPWVVVEETTHFALYARTKVLTVITKICGGLVKNPDLDLANSVTLRVPLQNTRL